MNVTCPDCRTVYRVDPAKVPSTGVRARCVRCPGEFDVAPEDHSSESAAPLAAAGALDAVATGAFPESRAAASEAAGGEDGDEAAAAPGPGQDQATVTSSGSAQLDYPPAEPDEPPLPPPPFGTSDPKVRARRLARALISDMVVYNSDRRERSLREGTLRQDFREEIRKSWEEYVSQVGNEIARETSYFQEALNEILAGGARQF